MKKIPVQEFTSGLVGLKAQSLSTHLGYDKFPVCKRNFKNYFKFSLAKIFYLSIQKLGNKKKVSQLTQSLVLSFAASLNTSRAALWRARRKLKKN